MGQYSQDVEKLQHHHSFLSSLLQSHNLECPCWRLRTFPQPPAVQCCVLCTQLAVFTRDEAVGVPVWFFCSERAGERLQNDAYCPAQLLLTGANEGKNNGGPARTQKMRGFFVPDMDLQRHTGPSHPYQNPLSPSLSCYSPVGQLLPIMRSPCIPSGPAASSPFPG